MYALVIMTHVIFGAKLAEKLVLDFTKEFYSLSLVPLAYIKLFGL